MIDRETDYSDKALLITGGTGSFGYALLERFLNTEIGEIRILSRDEVKQEHMRHEIRRKAPEKADRLKFYVGDVRDYSSVTEAIRGVDHVFHAAALKQVPSCEFYPMEAVKTNVLGTENVLNAAVSCGVKSVMCLSADNAVFPVNAMGMSKALMEKLAIAKSRISGDTRICITRCGNVACSRGSVIPLWIDEIAKGKPITVTDGRMTRFVMSLDEAVELVLNAFITGKNGDIFVKKTPACPVMTQAEAVCELFGADSSDIRTIGVRHGEKMFETLLSADELYRAVDMGEYFRIPADLPVKGCDAEYPTPIPKQNGRKNYNSNNAVQLSLEEMKEFLADIDYVKAKLSELEKARIGV